LDPAGQGTNPYAYAGNNPITNVDPLGLMAIPPGGSSFSWGPDWKKRFLLKCLSDAPGARHSLGWLPGRAITGADYLWSAMYVASMYDVSLQEAQIALNLMESGLLTMQQALSNAEYVMLYGGSLWGTIASALRWVGQGIGKTLSWAWNHSDIVSVGLTAANTPAKNQQGNLLEPHHDYLGAGLASAYRLSLLTKGHLLPGFQEIGQKPLFKALTLALTIDDFCQHTLGWYSPIHDFAVRQGFYWGGNADIRVRITIFQWNF